MRPLRVLMVTLTLMLAPTIGTGVSFAAPSTLAGSTVSGNSGLLTQVNVPTVQPLDISPVPPGFNFYYIRTYFTDAAGAQCKQDGLNGYNNRLWHAWHCWMTGWPHFYPVELWVHV